MPSNCGKEGSTARGRAKPTKPKIEKVEPRAIKAFVTRRKPAGIIRPRARLYVEDTLDPQTEWLVQEYGCLETKAKSVSTPRVDKDVVDTYLQAARWVYATTRFDPFVEPADRFVAEHETCRYCICACAPKRPNDCEHCKYYPNSHVSRCYGFIRYRSGNLAYILRHLPGNEPAGPEVIEAVRAAFKERPLEYIDEPSAKGYVLAGAGSTRRLLEANFVAMASSGYEGYLMLLHDGGQLQGYGSTEEYAALVSTRRLAVYEEPEVCTRKVPLPLGHIGAVTRSLHYQTTCLHWWAYGHNWDLWDGKAPVMKPGCGPVLLSEEHRSIRITFANAHSSMPAETRDLKRRMVKDIRNPCHHVKGCTTEDDTRLAFSYHIVDRDGDGKYLKTFNSGWIWFDVKDCKVIIDLYK